MPAARKHKFRYRTRRTRAEGVAERPVETSAAAPALKSVWVEVAPNGRVVIPVALRRSLGVESGGSLMFRVEGGEVTLMSREAAIKSVQDLVAKHVKKRGSMVDELIAERREEARREHEGR